MSTDIGTSTVETPAEMLERALVNLEQGADPDRLLRVAVVWEEKWARLVEEQEAGAQLDGRASIYTGETYAEARDRGASYRGHLLDHLRGVDGGGA